MVSSACAAEPREQPSRAPASRSPCCRHRRRHRLSSAGSSEAWAEGVVAGPVDTTSATAEPAATLVPDAGLWLITLPEGTVALDCCEIAPTASPAPVIAVVAAACV